MFRSRQQQQQAKQHPFLFAAKLISLFDSLRQVRAQIGTHIFWKCRQCILHLMSITTATMKHQYVSIVIVNTWNYITIEMLKSKSSLNGYQTLLVCI